MGIPSLLCYPILHRLYGNTFRLQGLKTTQESVSSPNQKQQPHSTPSRPPHAHTLPVDISPAARPTTTDPSETFSYKVASIPGQQTKGIITTKRIAQFGIIMSSFPAMVADTDLFPAADEDKEPVEGPRLFRRALEQLTDQGRFLDLATIREGRLQVVDDVIGTNALGIYNVDGRDAIPRLQYISLPFR